MCLFFIDNAMAGVGSVLLRGVVKHFQPRTGEQMVKSLENLEKNLWGKSLGELSESDIKQLMKSGFDPEKIIKDMEKFKREILPEGIGVFLPEEGRYVLVKTYHRMSEYIDSPVFLRWWSQDDFRRHAFFYIQKGDLAGNSELLLRWWDEAKVTGMEEQLESYMRSSLKEVVDNFSPDEVMERLNVDPFLDTVFKTIKESEFFSDDMKPILERLFKEFWY